MVRLGLVGTNTSHAGVFSKIFNGTADSAPLLEGGRIVAVWDNRSPEGIAQGASEQLVDAPTLAANHGIDSVVDNPTQMIGAVDAVLVIDNTGLGATHGHLARPFIEAGIPTFIDKPMTLDIEEATALFDLAERHGTPLMSSSALRYAREVAELQERAAGIGPLSSVVSIGPGDWYNYGVHAVEMYQTLVGPGAQWVHRFTTPQRDIAVIGYDDGPSVVVETLRDARYVFHLTAYGAKGWTAGEVTDAMAFYTRMMAAVLEMVHSRHSPISRTETLEVLAVLHAGERSAKIGQRVQLADVLSYPKPG